MTEPATTPTTPDEQTPRHRYNADLVGQIERTWQQTWSDCGSFNVANPVGSLAPQDGSAVPGAVLPSLRRYVTVGAARGVLEAAGVLRTLGVKDPEPRPEPRSRRRAQ